MPDYNPETVDRFLLAFLSWQDFVEKYTTGRYAVPAETGMRLISATQSIDPRALWKWAAETDADYNHDWRAFLLAFKLPSGEIPDSGGIRVALHNFIDEAKGRPLMRWGY